MRVKYTIVNGNIPIGRVVYSQSDKKYIILNSTYDKNLPLTLEDVFGDVTFDYKVLVPIQKVLDSGFNGEFTIREVE